MVCVQYGVVYVDYGVCMCTIWGDIWGGICRLWCVCVQYRVVYVDYDVCIQYGVIYVYVYNIGWYM